MRCSMENRKEKKKRFSLTRSTSMGGQGKLQTQSMFGIFVFNLNLSIHIKWVDVWKIRTMILSFTCFRKIETNPFKIKDAISVLMKNKCFKNSLFFCSFSYGPILDAFVRMRLEASFKACYSYSLKLVAVGKKCWIHICP